MRILIGTYEICGWVALFQKVFTRLGHKCDSLVKMKHPFYSSSRYTFNASRYHLKEEFFRAGRIRNFVHTINEAATKTYLSSFVARNAGQYDLVIYIWDTILPAFEDVEKFRQQGAKIIFLFVGSEVRTYKHFSNDYDVSQWVFPDYWAKEDMSPKLRYVQGAEKYADLIYSVPDQAGLQTRPYYHLQIPIDLSKFTYRSNERKVPVVLHLPSDPWKKGTDIIEKTINELIAEGVHVKFISLRSIKHDSVPTLLQDVDILVDEIVYHGPGVLSFEAMASGCAVATRYLESSPPCFRPPVWSVNAIDIKDKLRRLFTDFDLRQKLIEDGKKFVEMNNECGKVVQQMLDNLHQPQPPDYH